MDKNTSPQLGLGLERLADLLRAQSWKLQHDCGLNPSQQSLLRRLAEHPEGLRLSQLASLLGLSAASLSDSVATLERRGDLVRKADPQDGRASRLRLAAAGKRRLQRLDRTPSPAISVAEGLSQEQQGQLLALLQLMIAKAQELGLASGFRTCLGCRFFRAHAHARSALPHHCDYLDRPFGQGDLRIDCAEQQPAAAEAVAFAIARLQRTNSP